MLQPTAIAICGKFEYPDSLMPDPFAYPASTASAANAANTAPCPGTVCEAILA